MRLTVRRRDDQIGQQSADRLVALVPERAFRRGIELGNEAVVVHRDDAIQ